MTGQLGLRGGLHRLSTGLIAYGVTGLAVALLGLVALGWTAGRVSSLADTVDGEVTQLASTLDRTADTLHDAGTSAVTFAVTLERTPPSVRQAATTIRNLRPNLQSIEAQLSGINILGSRPLADSARLFGDMAADLQGLDTRLDLIAADLESDRDALLRNAEVLQLFHRAAEFGVTVDNLRADYGVAHARSRQVAVFAPEMHAGGSHLERERDVVIDDEGHAVRMAQARETPGIAQPLRRVRGLGAILQRAQGAGSERVLDPRQIRRRDGVQPAQAPHRACSRSGTCWPAPGR